MKRKTRNQRKWQQERFYGALSALIAVFIFACLCHTVAVEPMPVSGAEYIESLDMDEEAQQEALEELAVLNG